MFAFSCFILVCVQARSPRKLLSANSDPLYFSNAFKESDGDFGGRPFLQLQQIDPSFKDLVPRTEFVAIQREAAAPNLEVAREQLHRDGYCVVAVRDLNMGTLEEIYQLTASSTEREQGWRTLTDKINGLDLFGGHEVEIKHSHPMWHATGNLHVDDAGTSEGTWFQFWIPAKSNKHLVVIPASSFDGGRAESLLSIPDQEQVKRHLEDHAKIPEDGAIVVFHSLDTGSAHRNDQVMHAGIMDEYAKDTRTLIPGDFQSVLVDLKVLEKVSIKQ